MMKGKYIKILEKNTNDDMSFCVLSILLTLGVVQATGMTQTEIA